MAAMRPGQQIVLTNPAEIVAALECRDLVPHPGTDDRDGATNRLRAEMARFSDPADHAGRRQAVVEAIAAVDPQHAHAYAAQLAAARLTGAPTDAVDIAGTVPTEALASCLALGVTPEQVVEDMAAIVGVIGRGMPSSVETDAATERMLALCAGRPGGGVPTVSILYQNFDATWSLLTTTLQARATRTPAVPAVPRTRRLATAEVALPGRTIAVGSEVLLEIGAAGLVFGAGPHRCPGQTLAEAIVAGILAAIDAARYEVDPVGITTDPDGRPVALPMSIPST